MLKAAAQNKSRFFAVVPAAERFCKDGLFELRAHFANRRKFAARQHFQREQIHHGDKSCGD